MIKTTLMLVLVLLLPSEVFANEKKGNEYICGINSRVVLANGHKQALVVGNSFVLKDITVEYGVTKISGVRTSKNSIRVSPDEKEYYIFILPNESDKSPARLVSSKINFSSDTLLWAGNNVCQKTIDIN
jgi:hypothetical protein